MHKLTDRLEAMSTVGQPDKQMQRERKRQTEKQTDNVIKLTGWFGEVDV